MSSVDLIVLGMIIENPRSAYDLKKDIEYHHLTRWLKVSVPSVYKKVLQLQRAGYLTGETRKDGLMPEKTIYKITPEGQRYFLQQLTQCSCSTVPLLFELNSVIVNLNKVDKETAMTLLDNMCSSLERSENALAEQSKQFEDIPLVGRTVFRQQELVYGALRQWLCEFKQQFCEESEYSDGNKSDCDV